MVSEQTVCLRRRAGSRGREVRFGRWPANDNVTPEILITHAATRTRVVAAGGTFYPWIDAQPVRGVHHLDAPARPGQRSAHQARLSIRFEEVTIKWPSSCTDKTAPKQIALPFAEAHELPDSAVGNEAPIHWRLLTTHRTERLEDALRCVDWYRQRWMIEQLFRTRWKGYASEAKLGPITLLLGLKRLAEICHGWTSAKKDVCID